MMNIKRMSRQKINESNEKAADAQVDEQLTDAVIGLLQAEIPEVMYTAETENFVRDYDSRLRMQGLDLNTYFKYTGQTLDTLRQQMRPQAEKQVKMRLALEAIAKLEALAASDEEIEEEYKKIAQAYNIEADQVKISIAKEDIVADIVVKKAFDLIKANASITKASKKRQKRTQQPRMAQQLKKAPQKRRRPHMHLPNSRNPPQRKTASKTTAKKDIEEK